MLQIPHQHVQQQQANPFNVVPGGSQSSNIGAELHLSALKDSFKQAANSLT
jgi:hypothetical protein